MGNSLLTQPTLLARLRDAHDSHAWSQFVSLYTPLLYGYCLRCGLQPADASDVTQEVMKSVACAIRDFEYDPRHGSFRGWLLTITRRKVSRCLEKLNMPGRGSGDSRVHRLIESHPDSSDLDQQQWEHQFRQRVFAWAAAQARIEFTAPTWQAFWQTAVENRPLEQVANELGLSRGAIYVARCRVVARLRVLVSSVGDDEPIPFALEADQ